jgi:DNA primase
MDPDELARNKGIEGVQAVLGEARGLLEHLVDEALDETFIQDDVFGKSQRVDLIVRLLSQEEDPIVRATLKGRVDQLAGRLDLARSPEAFRALEASVRRQLAAEQRPQRTVDPQNARIADAPGRRARSEIVGALIEYPVLLGDPEVHEALHLLEGESAKTVAVLAQCLRTREPKRLQEQDGDEIQQKDAPEGEIALDTGSFLAQMPPAIQAFASRRMAAPEHASLEEARVTLLMNASKLRDMHSRDASEVQREMKHAEDFAEKLALAKELLDRSRKARGINH